MSNTNFENSQFFDYGEEDFEEEGRHTYPFGEEEHPYEWAGEEDWKEERDEEEKKVKKDEKKTRPRKKVTIAADVVDEEDKPSTPPVEGKTPVDRRKTIYELESYAFSEMMTKDADISAEEAEEELELESKYRYSNTLGIPGLVRIYLSPLTQKIVGCEIDENVTTEYPWIYVRKEIIEDNLDLHSESSDFLPVEEEIKTYPKSRMLIGYAPTPDDEEGQFYICVTEDGHDTVARRLDALRREQETRVHKAVYKTPGYWNPLGSHQDVDQATVKNSRPLFQIEVESMLSQLKLPLNLVDRTSEDQRDGYVEIVPYRESFTNVTRMLVDKALKVTPNTKEDEAQTLTAVQVNSLCQCGLDQESSAEPVPDESKGAEQLLKSRTDEVCEQIFTNTTWDVYANDYEKLAAEAEAAGMTTTRTEPYVEWKSYYDGKLCKGRVINDLAWHPQWTGVMATTYTTVGRSENLLGPKPPDKTLDESNQVLVWSFDDCLKPKLILESQRQVTSVSFCPRNGNIVIGGCSNGQIVIWDITGKIQELEKVVVRTAAQVKYETVMRSLSAWMKEWGGASILRPTVTSSFQFSQRGSITKIEWLPPYNKIDDKGSIHDLPADTDEDDLSLQFITSSEDGSIAFWDLNWRPTTDKKGEELPKRKKSVQKPENLAQSTSPLKVLDKIFKPVYMLIVQTINETRNAVITAISLPIPKLSKTQIPPFPKSNDITSRKYYTVNVEKLESKRIREKKKKEKVQEFNPGKEKKEEVLVSVEIFVCTARGECGLVSWEGFDFSTGSSVNQEVCKWTWCKQVHDGPISHAVRSQYLDDVILTVGGRVFAIWREDYDQPLFWRKSEYRYTACCWDNNKPTVIILGRNDGTIEIWDFCIKSHQPNITQSLSGRIITGIYAHELPLNPQCIGFCDFNGALRIFLAPKVLDVFRLTEVEWMRQLIDREVNRIKDFNKWRQEWNEMNAKSVEKEELSEEEAARKAAIEEQMKNEAAAQEAAKIEAARKAKARERKSFIERMRARWVTRELGRMQTVILESKGLKGEELERRREPVVRMEREAREKKAKLKQVYERADELFVEAVKANFPQQQQKLLSALTLPSDGRQDSVPLGQIIAIGDHETEDDRIIQDFEELESNALSSMRRSSHAPDFNWQRIIDEGIRRRKSMDINLKLHKIKVNRSESNEASDRLSSLQSFDNYELETDAAPETVQ